MKDDIHRQGIKLDSSKFPLLNVADESGGKIQIAKKMSYQWFP